MIPITQSIRRRIDVVMTDITTLNVDAIVNSARPDMSPGGWTDLKVHKAAGPKLRQACSEYISREGRCFAGGAILTPAFDLPCRYVVHAVGPMWCGGAEGEEALLTRAYAKALEIARVHGLRSIAFSAISTSSYGYPKELAAQTAISVSVECLEMEPLFERIIFCVNDEENKRIYEKLLDEGCRAAEAEAAAGASIKP